MTGETLMDHCRLLTGVVVTAAALCLILQPALTAGAEANSISDVKKLKLNIDVAGFAKTKHFNIIKAMPNHPDEPPSMNGEPEHLRVTFDNDKLSDYTNYLERQLNIYPIKPYASLFRGKEKSSFDAVVTTLKKILKNKSDNGIQELPILPPGEGFEVFRAHEEFLNFSQGSGIAFLTGYHQDEGPIRNDDLFYAFQGLTNDGKYYVSFFCPVKASGLQETLPSKKGAQYLTKLSQKQFTPALDKINQVIQSITLK